MPTKHPSTQSQVMETKAVYAIQEQRTPKPNGELSAHGTYTNKIAGTELKLLIVDILARQQKGLQTYGVPLQPYNGRNHLIDCYQELLDALVYLECKIRETHDPRVERIQTAIAHQALQVKCLLEPSICKDNNSGIEL